MERKNESEPVLRLLPAFDEYLISYKNRTDVLPLEHHPKAFNRFGTFYPVILYNGKIIGNWGRSVKKNSIQIEMDFFEKKPRIPVKLIQQAEAQINAFYGAYRTTQRFNVGKNNFIFATASSFV